MHDQLERRDFFISFNNSDLPYATAIDSALRAEGFTTFFYPRDLRPGGNIAAWMDEALLNSAQILALYSPDYIKDQAVYSKAERYAGWWQDPTGDQRKLIPVLLRETKLTPLIAVLKHINVIGMMRDEAATHVVSQIRGPHETTQRNFWRGSLPLPKVFRAAYRPNPNFSGRFEPMESLERSLRSGKTPVTAITGMAGLGKTTLAAEYCHRFGGRYSGVWWVRTDQDALMFADLQTLAQELGVAKGHNIEADARLALGHLSNVTEPWLLIYDNAPYPDAVRNWLPSGAVRAIITSRFIDFSEIGHVITLSEWQTPETENYLLSRTGRSDLLGARRLAERIGGLPLAAEHASAYLKLRPGVTFDDYATDLVRLIKRKQSDGITGNYPDTVHAAIVKSFETLKQMPSGATALDILRMCAFLSPDGVDLFLLTLERCRQILPTTFATAMGDQFAREDALAALTSLSLLRRKSDSAQGVIVFHRLLLEILRDWMGEDDRQFWGSIAVRLIDSVFPYAENKPETWPVCNEFMPHVMPLEASVPRTGDAGSALSSLLTKASVYHGAEGLPVSGLMLAERAVALQRQRQGEDPLALVRGLSTLRARYLDLDKLDDAETVCREALQLAEQLLKPTDERYAVAIGNLANIYWLRKNFAAAEPLYVRSLEITKAARGADSLEYGRALSNLASTYAGWAESGRSEFRAKAQQHAFEALAVTVAAAGIRNPETALQHHNLAFLKSEAGDWSGAVADSERAVAIMLSLHLLHDARTQNFMRGVVHLWKNSNHCEKATRLQNGDISDILPVIRQIEAEHRAWVAESPKTRFFGPISEFEGRENTSEQLLTDLRNAGIDVNELMRRMRSGQLSKRQFKRLLKKHLGRSID